MSLYKYVGDPDGYKKFLQQIYNHTRTERFLTRAYSSLVQGHWTAVMKYGIGFSKAIGFPLGLLLQILTVIFLVRGNTGFSPSAKKWFLLVVGADIAGTLYRTYELFIDDFLKSSPYETQGPGSDLQLLMWGLRSKEHGFIQDVMCRVFFIIIYFPLYLSPFALTTSSLLRCYCVKYPLVAKVHLTKRLDLFLIMVSSFLALAVSVVLGALVIEGWSSVYFPTNIHGIPVFNGRCTVPSFRITNTDKDLQFVGFIFMLTVAFFICFLNMVSASVIITVLFQSKKDRALLSASANQEADGVSMEARATARLLGMNVTLLLCFFFSRLLLVVSTRVDNVADPILYVVSDRLAALLFHIPYFTNSLFIAGLSRSFYRFLLPCFQNSKLKLSSSDSQRTF